MTRGLRLVFAGTPAFAVPALEALAASRHPVIAVYTQPDRPAGRGRRLQASPVKRCATGRGIPVFQPASLRTAPQQSRLAGLNPDVVVTAAYGLILPAPILTTPSRGCINIHASLLPRWRGAAPVQRAILAGDDETGVTIIQMARGVDTGDILLQHGLKIYPADTAGSLAERLAELGARAVLEALDACVQDALHPRRQDETQASHAPKLDKDDAWLDWRHDAETLGRQIRAYHPWPVTCTTLAGQRLRILKASVHRQDSAYPPGTVSSTPGGPIRVAAGVGELQLEEVQLAGRKPVTAAEFSRTHALAGVCLPS